MMGAASKKFCPSAYILISLLFLFGNCSGGKMDIDISARIDKPAQPSRLIDDIPVYPMGQDLVLTAEFANPGKNDLAIDDPKTSIKVQVHLVSDNDPHEVVFRLNPPVVDSTGERTLPPSTSITLHSRQSVAVSFELFKYVMDKCFLPGNYTIAVEFSGVKSLELEYAVEFCPESVPKLVTLGIDEKASMWIRRESTKWLGKMPKSVEIILPSGKEMETERAAREAKNRDRARQFLGSWPYEKETDAMKSFFEQMKLDWSE